MYFKDYLKTKILSGFIYIAKKTLIKSKLKKLNDLIGQCLYNGLLNVFVFVYTIKLHIWTGVRLLGL